MTNQYCGQAGPSGIQFDLKGSLDRMRKELARGSSHGTAILDHNRCGMACTTSESEKYLKAIRGVLATYSGHPYWSDNELESLHIDSGFAESLLTAYELHGSDLLRLLHGSFSIAVIDSNSDEALIATDRAGTSKVYFGHTQHNGLRFGTSLQGVIAGCAEYENIRLQALFEYLYFHVIPAPGTVRTGLHRLRPGERLCYQGGRVSVAKYWLPRFDEETRASRKDLELELHRILRRAVTRCSSDPALGCFLSGGIDSSTIAGLLAEIQPPAKTFTIGFDEPGYDETSFARDSANAFDTNHSEYIVSPANVVAAIPAIAEAYDEPFGNSSAIPTYYCALMAKEAGITTLLGGDGGDELFGGNERYVTQQLFDIYSNIPRFLRTGFLEPVICGMPALHRLPPFGKLNSYIRQANVPMPDRMQSYNYFSRTEPSEILDPVFLNAINTSGPLDLMRSDYDGTESGTLLNRMLALDWSYTLAYNDFQKVNVMCNLAGVDVRYPFADDDLIEFSSRIPPEMKISVFRLRHFFKQAVQNLLPPQVLSKKKHGFGLPFGIWMRSFGPLQELASDSLSDLSKRKVIRPAYVDMLLEAHRSEHAHYYGEFIWILMMLEQWLQKHEPRFSC